MEEGSDWDMCFGLSGGSLEEFEWFLDCSRILKFKINFNAPKFRDFKIMIFQLENYKYRIEW